MAKYIKFEMAGKQNDKDLFVIQNRKSGAVLGQIVWYPPWNQYVFISDENAIWSQDCLQDVREFILNGTGA
jgi:hypothetical protein